MIIEKLTEKGLKQSKCVIKITSFTGCGTEVTQYCINNNVTNLEGEDQQGRDWEICTLV